MTKLKVRPKAVKQVKLSRSQPTKFTKLIPSLNLMKLQDLVLV